MIVVIAFMIFYPRDRQDSVRDHDCDFSYSDVCYPNVCYLDVCYPDVCYPDDDKVSLRPMIGMIALMIYYPGDRQDSVHDHDFCYPNEYPDDDKSQSELFLFLSNDCEDRAHNILSP